MPLGWLAGGQSLKPLLLPPQDRFVLHSSPGDGKQMVLDGEGEVTKEAGDLLPTNLLVGGWEAVLVEESDQEYVSGLDAGS